MPFSPWYGDQPVITIPGRPHDQLAPLSRQRRRLEAVLKDLCDDEWRAESRCTGWSVRDVAAHLVGVNRFWSASVRAGLEGRPTRLLVDFDPIATPARMVAESRDLPARTVLDLFVSSNDELLGVLGGIDDDGWEALAETPPGHLPIRLLASHALWDSWVHERDVVLPLRRVQAMHPDEVSASLRYVCTLTTAFAILTDAVSAGSLGVDAVNPDQCFTLDVAAGIALRDDGPLPTDSTLRGDAVGLIEALSTRTPFTTPLPSGWDRVMGAFASVFEVRA